MADVFAEVDDQLRTARLQTFIERGWPFAVAFAVAGLLVALGAWGWNKHELKQEANASIAYEAGVNALSNGDATGADKSFAAAASSGAAGYRSLALMQQAQIRLSRKQTAAAMNLLDQAAKGAPDAIIGDAARLKAAFIAMDTEPYAAVEARLTPLTGDKSPYRSIAREALGMERLQVGKLNEAKGDFEVLALSQDVSDAARARAHAALDLIESGSASAIAPVVKAAAAAAPTIAPTLPGATPSSSAPAAANAGAAR